MTDELLWKQVEVGLFSKNPLDFTAALRRRELREFFND